jgi:hypothetical protein
MPTELIFTIAAVITAIGVIIGGIVAIYRLARRIQDSIGLDEKGRTISERLDRVEHQLWPNGGSSLADQVKCASDTSKENHVELQFIKQLLLANNPGYVPALDSTTESPMVPVRRTRKKAS